MYKGIVNKVNSVFLCIGVIIGSISTVEAGKITLVTPTSGTVGSRITVEGIGYSPSESIRIDLSNQYGAVRSYCSDEGTFSTSFILGKHPAGVNTFVVVAFPSYSLERGTVAVKSRISLITPTSGKVGEFVTIEGDGYGSREEICVGFGQNKDIKTISTDAQGGFRVVFTTDSQPTGRKNIIATGLVSGESNSVEYVLKAGISSVIPTYGYVGSIVTVEGAGFGENESIRVDFGKTEGILYTTSTFDGRCSFTFTVDTQSEGRKDIIVNGISTGEKGEGGFIITPNIKLVTPSEGTVGITITIVATGFGESEPIRIDIGRNVDAGRTTSDSNGALTTQINVTSQPGKEKRRLSVVGMRTRKISFTDVFTTLPSIKITPTMGEIGTNVGIHGEGFPSNEPIRIDFAKITTVATGVVDERMGNFDVGFKIPPHPAGKAEIKVVMLKNGEILIDNFIVTPRIKLISPTATGRLGDLIEIQGDGFAASELVQINLGETEGIGEGITDLDGNFSITFKVDTQPGGKKTCTVTGVKSNSQKTTVFTIKEKILITPTSGTFGTVVNIKGSGYKVSESIRVDFGETTIATPTADDIGTFEANFTVNTKIPNKVRVRAIGLDSWTVNNADFMVVEEIKEEEKEIKSEESSEKGVKEGEQKEEETQEQE